MPFFRVSVCLLFLALPLAASAAPKGADEDGREIYLVSFKEAPVASFRGLPAAAAGGVALKATSPAATGEFRLDVGKSEVRAYRKHLAERREAHLGAAERLIGRALQPTFEYDIVNHAVAVELSAAEAQAIARLPGVLFVEPEPVYELHTDAGPRWIGAEQIWNATDGLGSRGAGRLIGIVDSGINATHPSFAAVGPVDGFVHTNPRGRFYGFCEANPARCNAKLIGIHDYTNCEGTNASTGCEDKETNDGSDVSGHGSHVASTAVGNTLQMSFTTGQTNNTMRLSGVAPHAALISYKACEKRDPGSTCRGSWTLAALNRAVADGVDVINYSIGSSDQRNPWSDAGALAMLAAREANVFVATSAGNNGPGEGTVGSPANAPWVMAVAASSHDRVIGNRLLDLSGGASTPPSGGVLFGVGSTGGYGPAPLLRPADHPGCSTGSGDTALPVTGASNPWGANRFAGEIVVCERGVQARVAKSNNVRLAGGGGMVLINKVGDGEGTVADEHSIPSTHLGFESGRALVDWLASGSDHRGRIEGSKVLYEAAFGDVLAGFSSRGPVRAGDFMKPALGAPGSNVLAASGSGNAGAFASGTSMASPHVAGAVLLVRSLRPTWTVTDIESALIGTARPVMRDSDGVSPATVMQQGAGRIDPAAALRAGLSFPVSRADFEAANPASGGDPRALNQPALVHGDCVQSCTLTRRVRDIAGGGRWRAEFSGVAGFDVQVSPQEFTLADGATQTLQVQLSISSPELIGSWAEGSLQLRRVDGSEGAVAATRVPVTVYASAGAVPAQIALSAASDRGFQDVELSGLVALGNLKLAATKPAALVRVERILPQDPTPSNVYDRFGEGNFIELLTIPATATPRTFRLAATTRSVTSVDIDLFVGLDEDGDGLPSQAEELCRSTGSDADERCELELESRTQPQTVWVLVQNWKAGATDSDLVTLETVLNDMAPSPALKVTGPSTVASAEAFALRFGWDLPDLLPGSTRISYLQLAIGDLAPFATVPVRLSRAAQATTTAARVLEPGRTQPIELLPGAAQDGLFVDVPANASALVVRSRSAGSIDLYAARVATPAGPATGRAPERAQAQASAVGAGGNKELRVAGATLEPGRWFITPVNSGSSTAALELDVTLEYAGPRVPMSPGAYYNPDRSGAGAFIYEAGSSWALIWYAFLQDGTPTWYLGAAAKPAANQGVWRVSLERYTWSGGAASATTVGEAILSFSEPKAFQFSWNVDGQTGSERYELIHPGACAQVDGNTRDLTGMWHAEDMPGVGFNVTSAEGLEAQAAFFYDAQGVARWLFGGASQVGPTGMELGAHFGFCPLCTYEPAQILPAGSLSSSYHSNNTGRIAVDFNWPAPLSGSWQFDRPVVKLTDDVGCTP
jgi:hypothetical protein